MRRWLPQCRVPVRQGAGAWLPRPTLDGGQRGGRTAAAQIARVVESAPIRWTTSRQIRWWFPGKPEKLEDEDRVALTQLLAEHADDKIQSPTASRCPGTLLRFGAAGNHPYRQARYFDQASIGWLFDVVAMEWTLSEIGQEE